MARNKITQYVNRFILFLVIINIMMLPVFSANIFNSYGNNNIVKEEIGKEIDDSRIFSRVVAIDDNDNIDNIYNNDQNKDSIPGDLKFLIVYITYLLGLLSLGILYKKGNKKAQATVWIIMGIVFLTLTLFYIAYRFWEGYQNKLDQQQVDYFNAEVERINTYIRECVSIKGYDGLFLLGEQGGYIEIPSYIRHQVPGKRDTSYWYLDEANIQPLLNETKIRLIRYVNENLKSCLNFDEYTESGFIIETGDVNTSVIIGAEDVTIRVEMPTLIQFEQFEQRYKEFSENYNIRFRRIWELASRYSNNFFDPNFDHRQPLANVAQGDFIVTMLPSFGEDYLVYDIWDDDSYVRGKNDYHFRFAYRNGPSTVPRCVELWPMCQIIPNFFPYVLYSRDRETMLIIKPGTTMNIPGGKCEICITQSYEQSVTGASEVVSRRYDGQIGMGFDGASSSPTWMTKYPIYDFTPDGTKSSQKMKLKLFWDEDYINVQDKMGIINDDPNWHPIDSNPDYTDHSVWADIDGFSAFSLADIGAMGGREAEAKDEEKPKSAPICILLLVVNTAIIVLSGGTLIPVAGAIGQGLTTSGGGDDDEKCTSFTPTADQVITIDKEEKDGKGDCELKGGGGMGGGGGGLGGLLGGLGGGGLGGLLGGSGGGLGLGDFGGGGQSFLGLGEGIQGITDMLSGVTEFGGDLIQDIQDIDYSQVQYGATQDDMEQLFTDFVQTYPQYFGQGTGDPIIVTGAAIAITGMAVAADTSQNNIDAFTSYLESQSQYFPENDSVVNQTTAIGILTNFTTNNQGMISSGYYLSTVLQEMNGYVNGHTDYFQSATGLPDTDLWGTIQNAFADISISDVTGSLMSQFGSLGSLMGQGGGGGLMGGAGMSSIMNLMGGGDTHFVQGGQEYKVCSKVKKCDALTSLLCKKCSVTCTAKYK
ncbi:MAG: hypothetical protein V1740_07265 [Candidatus Woesearchaeota archaeon]